MVKMPQSTQADFCRDNAARYVVNSAYTQAVLFFADGSYLQAEHTSRENRWVRASTADSVADRACRAMTGFRLNAKHLQLYFEDGSDVEFGEKDKIDD